MPQRKSPLEVAPTSKSDAVRPVDLRWRPLAGTLLIIVLACCVYFPSYIGGFIFDDDLLLTENSLIKAPDGLMRFWYTTEQPDYVPLTSSTLWIEWRLWGMDPTGYRLVNLALHIAGSLLLWRLLGQLAIPGAFLAALLYGVHPVNVESVAWIEQLKDTLSMLFFLLSILWYLRAEEGRAGITEEEKTRRGEVESRGGVGFGLWYWLSLVAFALAMFSKGSVAVLPLILLLIMWWRRGQIIRRDLFRVAPFLLVAAIMTPVIVWFVFHSMQASVRDVTFVQRLLGAGAVVWFYLAKAFLPIHLVFVYPPWDIRTSDLLWWLPLFCAFTVTGVLFRRRNAGWTRPLFFAWGFFCLAILPVLGFSDPGYMQFSLVADHYQHIALIAVVTLIAAGCSAWKRWSPQPLRPLAIGAASALVAIVCVLTWQQCRLYGDGILLYQATLKENPNSWMVHNNLGIELANANRPEEAINHFQTALNLNPRHAVTYNNLGNALLAVGRLQAAIERFQQSLLIQPKYAEPYNGLGTALLKMAQPEQSVEYFEQALRFKPDFPLACANLAAAFALTNRPAEAVATAQKAVELARLQGQTEFAVQIEDWLRSFRSNPDAAPKGFANPRLPPLRFDGD